MKTTQVPERTAERSAQRTAKLPAIKEMPAAEKYSKVMADVRSMKRMVIAFVRERLSEEAVSELVKRWREGIRPIPKDASPEEKYETAYRNFIWMSGTSLSFIRERLGEEGLAEWERVEVEGLKRSNAGPALLLLSLVKAVSPGLAFSVMARQMAYEFQWLTPFSVSELSPDKAVFSIPRCKVLDYPGAEDVCQVGCQRVYPRWQAEQFKVKMAFEREDHSCTCTVTPLRSEERV